MTATYITQKAADEWAKAREISEWSDIETSTKNAYLLRAAEWIDRYYRFKGRRENTSQIRAWPRYDAFNDGEAITGIPQAVKDASMILAIALIDGEEAAEKILGLGSKIKQQKAAGIEVQYDLGTYQPSHIDLVLAPITQSKHVKQLRRG